MNILNILNFCIGYIFLGLDNTGIINRVKRMENLLIIQVGTHFISITFNHENTADIGNNRKL